MSKAHRLTGNQDLNRHQINGDSGPLPAPIRKPIAVRMDAYHMLHGLQLSTEPRIDLSYFASAAIQQAFENAGGQDAIRTLAVALARRDFEQLPP